MDSAGSSNDRCTRLLEELEDNDACIRSSLLQSSPLGLAEPGGDADYSTLNLLTQEVFSRLDEGFEEDRGDFKGSKNTFSRDGFRTRGRSGRCRRSVGAGWGKRSRGCLKDLNFVGGLISEFGVLDDGSRYDGFVVLDLRESMAYMSTQCY